jgi:hypothetical protein
MTELLTGNAMDKSSNGKQVHILDLPWDLCAAILEFCQDRDGLALISTCKSLREAALNDPILLQDTVYRDHLVHCPLLPKHLTTEKLWQDALAPSITKDGRLYSWSITRRKRIPDKYNGWKWQTWEAYQVRLLWKDLMTGVELVQDLDELCLGLGINWDSNTPTLPAIVDLGEANLLIAAVSGAFLFTFSRESPSQPRVEELSEHDFSDACYSHSGKYLAIYSRKGFYLLVYEVERDAQGNVKLKLLFEQFTYAIRFGGDTRNSYMQAKIDADETCIWFSARVLILPVGEETSAQTEVQVGGGFMLPSGEHLRLLHPAISRKSFFEGSPHCEESYVLHAEESYKPSSRDVKAAERRVFVHHLPSVQAHTLTLRRDETIRLLNEGQLCAIMSPVHDPDPESLGERSIVAIYECRDWKSVILPKEKSSRKWRLLGQLRNGILMRP